MKHKEGQKEKWILCNNHDFWKRWNVPLQSRASLATVSAMSWEARIRLGYTIWGIMPRRESEFRPNLLDMAEKLTPVRPITDTKSKLPEVGSDTAHGAKSLGSNGVGVRFRTGQKHKVQGNFQEYPWNFHIHLYASVCAWHMRCLSGWKHIRWHALFIRL